MISRPTLQAAPTRNAGWPPRRFVDMRCSAAGQARQPRRGKLAPRTRIDPQLRIGDSRILITAPPPASGYGSYLVAGPAGGKRHVIGDLAMRRNRPQRHHTPE